VVNVELEKSVVKDASDGCYADLTRLLRVHGLQFHPSLKLMVGWTLARRKSCRENNVEYDRKRDKAKHMMAQS